MPYKVHRTPATIPVEEVFSNPERGTNCELLAQAITRARGFIFPPLRSSEVFEDREFTIPVAIENIQTGDMVGFKSETQKDYFGVHVGIAWNSPDGVQIVHNARHQNRALIQALDDVTSHKPHGRIAWIKRPIVVDPLLASSKKLKQIGLEFLA